MCADHTAQQRLLQTAAVIAPERRAVRHIFLQQGIAQAGVAEQDRQGKVDAAALAYLLHKQVVALLRAARLADHGHGPVFQRNDRLDAEQPARERRCA